MKYQNDILVYSIHELRMITIPNKNAKGPKMSEIPYKYIYIYHLNSNPNA